MNSKLLETEVYEFISLLNDGFFDLKKYVSIEEELLNIARKESESLKIEKKIIELFYFFSFSISTSFYFHINDNDVFEVTNIDEEELKLYSDKANALMRMLLGVSSYNNECYYFR